MSVIVPSYTRSGVGGLPAPGNAGSLARVSDNVRGLWMDSGTRWFGINGEIGNVRDFGAIGDGTLDDSSAIQSALNACATLFFPPGTYYIGTTTLNLSAGHTLFGAGYNASIISYAGNGDAIKYDSGYRNSSGYALVTIQDLTVSGGSAGNTGAGIDIVAGGFAYFNILRVRVTGTNGGFKYGIVLDQAEIARVQNSIIENGAGISNSVNIWLTDGDEHTNTESQTVNSLTHSGSVVTATVNATHPWQTNQRLTIANASHEPYNGSQTITRTGTTTFTYDLTKAVESITRSGSTATVKTAAPHHYATSDTIAIAGATQANYNGNFTITKVDDTTFAYTVSGSPTTPATGTITALASPTSPDGGGSITASVTMAVGFTNVVQIEDNQFNNGVIGVADDGGDNHTIRNNNFNGNSLPLRVAGCSSIVIVGNTFETQLTTGPANVLFSNRSWAGGGAQANKAGCNGGIVHGNTFAGQISGSSNAMLTFTNDTESEWHTGISVSGNHFEEKLGRGAAIDVTRLRWSFAGSNQDDAPNIRAHYTGIHNDGNGNTLFTPGDTSDVTEVFRWGRSDAPHVFHGGIIVGNDDGSQARLARILTQTMTWDPPSIADGAVTSTVLSLTGAAVGDTVMVTHDQLGSNYVLLTGYVQTANSVRVVLMNKNGSALDLPSGTLRVFVFKSA